MAPISGGGQAQGHHAAGPRGRTAGRSPSRAASAAAAAAPPPLGSEFHHDFHFSFNRRLSCYSHAVSSLAFSKGGSLLCSAAGAGDVKLWGTSSWAEAGRLKNVLREQVRSLTCSPEQRWLVVAYPTFLQVFSCAPPWKLEQTVPSPVDEFSQESSEWVSLAFSPFADSDLHEGRSKFDQLAASTEKRLFTLDFSRGWQADVIFESRSLVQSGRPTALCYTACGRFIVCGSSSGALQVWCATSLTLEHTLASHTDTVTCLASSPRHTPYEPRIVSCSADQTLRVWGSQDWHIDMHVHDLRCDRAGLKSVQFSAAGDWLLSVGTELCIWRVIPGRAGRLFLGLHQRLASISGGDGVRSVAFGQADAIAVGSRDGVLGILTKHEGLPADPGEEAIASFCCPGSGLSSGSLATPDPVILVRDRSLSRQMQRAERLSSSWKPQGSFDGRPQTQPSKRQLRSTTDSFFTSPAATGEPPATSPMRASRRGDLSTCTTTVSLAAVLEAAAAAAEQPLAQPASSATMVRARNSGAMQRVVSMPDLPKVKTQESRHAVPRRPAAEPLALDVVPAAHGGSPLGARVRRRLLAGAEVDLTPLARKRVVQRVSKGLVQRICLDPKSITVDHGGGTLGDG